MRVHAPALKRKRLIVRARNRRLNIPIFAVLIIFRRVDRKIGRADERRHNRESSLQKLRRKLKIYKLFHYLLQKENTSSIFPGEIYRNRERLRLLQTGNHRGAKSGPPRRKVVNLPN